MKSSHHLCHDQNQNLLYLIDIVVLWKSLLLRHGGQSYDNLDISSLAKVSDGYTPGHLNTVITQVLSERRIQQLRRRPLTAAEFIPFMSKIDPIYREEEEAYKVCIQTYSISTQKHTH